MLAVVVQYGAVLEPVGCNGSVLEPVVTPHAGLHQGLLPLDLLALGLSLSSGCAWDQQCHALLGFGMGCLWSQLLLDL